MAMKQGELAMALAIPEVFTHEQFGEIRTIIEDGEIHFVAVDACRALEIVNPTRSLANFDDDEKGFHTVKTLGGNQKMLTVTEAGLYRLIFMSRKPNAKEFQRWIFHEVIPKIRTQGGYAVPGFKVVREDAITVTTADGNLNLDLIEKFVQDAREKEAQIAALTTENGELKTTVAAQGTKIAAQADVIEMQDAQIALQEGVIEAQDAQIERMKPKESYYDLIMMCPDLVPTTTIAKDYGMGAAKFNKLLHELGVQFKQSGIWYLYQNYAALGWMKTRTHNYPKDGEMHAKVHSYWTHAGWRGLYDLLKEKGYLPKIEQPKVEEELLWF